MPSWRGLDTDTTDLQMDPPGKEPTTAPTSGEPLGPVDPNQFAVGNPFLEWVISISIIMGLCYGALYVLANLKSFGW